MVGFLLKTFILYFSAIVSEYRSGSTSFQKQQINGNQTYLVLFLFRKLFQMYPGTRLERQFCKNNFLSGTIVVVYYIPLRLTIHD